MKVVVSAGINNQIVYPHDGFVNCFENFGNMFAKAGHDTMYLGLANLIDNTGLIQDCDLWITEFNTKYIPLYLVTLNSKRKGKVWFVQHGSYDEFNRYDAWALKAINMGDAYLANTLYSKRFIENIIDIAVHNDIVQPIPDKFFSYFSDIGIKNGRILIGHVGGREYPKEDPRRYHLLATSLFKDYPMTLITRNQEYNRKFGFCDDIEFVEPINDGDDYYSFFSKFSYYVSVSTIPTLGRDIIIAACSGVVSISSPYYYQEKLFPSLTAYNINDFFQFKNTLNSDNSFVLKNALSNAREFSMNSIYRICEERLGW